MCCCLVTKLYLTLFFTLLTVACLAQVLVGYPIDSYI